MKKINKIMELLLIIGCFTLGGLYLFEVIEPLSPKLLSVNVCVLLVVIIAFRGTTQRGKG